MTPLPDAGKTLRRGRRCRGRATGRGPFRRPGGRQVGRDDACLARQGPATLTSVAMRALGTTGEPDAVHVPGQRRPVRPRRRRRSVRTARRWPPGAGAAPAPRPDRPGWAPPRPISRSAHQPSRPARRGAGPRPGRAGGRPAECPEVGRTADPGGRRGPAVGQPDHRRPAVGRLVRRRPGRPAEEDCRETAIHREAQGKG